MTSLRLESSIHIDRPVREVFVAWTSAEQLRAWFAPMAVRRPDVTIDFRVAGHYSIRMTLEDGAVLTTSGVFEEIVADEKLVMTWWCDAFPDPPTRVTVRFVPERGGTRVTVVHENFAFDATRANHQDGWHACLEALSDLLTAANVPDPETTRRP